MEMANMLLRARKTSTYVSTNLSMSLFDKYVSPVFPYRSAVIICYIWKICPKVRALERQSLEHYETAVAIMCRSQTPGELAKSP